MTSAPTAESVVARAIADAIRPDPPLSVWKWADEYRMLSSKAASAPGKYRSERTPYLREIMDCLSVESPVRKVVVKKPARTSGWLNCSRKCLSKSTRKPRPSVAFAMVSALG